MTTILKIDSSARYEDSESRKLTGKLVQKISTSADKVIERDLNKDVFFISENSLQAVSTDPAMRNDEQQELAKLSDIMIEELQQADIIVIGAPIYNFGTPSNLKAWADLVARAGTTFKYSDNGPVGLLQNKMAYIMVASGGTAVGGEMDFMTPWLKFFLAFLGITDVEVIAADGIFGLDGEEKIRAANEKIETLAVPDPRKER